MNAYVRKKIATQRRFILYVIIGGFAALFDLAIVFTLTSIVGIYYLLSVVISYPVATFIHFIMNKYLNFRNKSKKLMQQFLVFVAINLVSLTLTIIIMYILVEWFYVHYLLAKITAMIIVVFFSFNMHRVITFRSTK